MSGQSAQRPQQGLLGNPNHSSKVLTQPEMANSFGMRHANGAGPLLHLNCLKVSSNINIYILKPVLKTLNMSLAVVAHTCNPGTQEAVAGEFE